MRIRIGLPISLLIMSLAALPAGAKERRCIDWPKAMAHILQDELPQGRSIMVGPFTDMTKQSGDEWLVLGLRDYLADLLKTSSDLRVFSGLTAVYRTDSTPPDYIIKGRFQHVEDSLRIFVLLLDGKTGGIVNQYPAKFPYPENKAFFTMIADIARQIMKQAEVRPNKRLFKAVRNATASTRCYESYSKGRQALETYQVKKAEVAAIWFSDAKRTDYRSPLGYQGMVDLYTFLGFYHKQRREPFLSYYQKAEQELVSMDKLAKPAPMLMHRKKAKVTKKRRAKKIELENRFLKSNVAFSEGMRAAQQGLWIEAQAALKLSVEEVSQDAITWYHLARIESKLGNMGAARSALKKALAINSCIKSLPLALPEPEVVPEAVSPREKKEQKRVHPPQRWE